MESDKFKLLSGIVIGSSDFIEVVKSSAYVDKTYLIVIFLSINEKVSLISCPRRFGKSTNLNMIKTFLRINVDVNGNIIDKQSTEIYQLLNSEMFKSGSLSIAKNKQMMDSHCCSHPVVFVSFLNCRGDSDQDFLDSIKTSLHRSFIEHNYLSNSQHLDEDFKLKFEFYKKKINYNTMSNDDLKNSLYFLTMVLYLHFNKKVFVLIDEYDAPINNAIQNKDIQIKKLNDLIDGLLCAVFKDNSYLDKGLMTGISSMARASASSGLNNVSEFKFLRDHSYSTFFGFSNQEVNQLFDLFSIDKDDRIKAQVWYDGYRNENSKMESIFNPWSIVRYIKEQKLGNYWESTGSINNILFIFKINGIRTKIEELIKGNEINVSIRNSFKIDDLVSLQKLFDFKGNELSAQYSDLFFTYLLELGYLSYSDVEGVFRAPNNEIKNDFEDCLIDYYVDNYLLSKSNFQCAIKALNKGIENENDNLKEFENALNILFQPITKTARFSDSEDLFHSLINSIAIEAKWAKFGTEVWYRNEARTDIVIINQKRDLGIVIEIKYSKLATEALQQAHKYGRIFENEPKILKIKYIGINISNDLKVSIEMNLEDI